jgi:hypothetical protein
VFSYTYPELYKLDSVSEEEGRIRLSKDINRLYGPTVPASQPVPKPSATPVSVPAPVGKGPDQSAPPERSAPKPSTTPASVTASTGKGPGEVSVKLTAPGLQTSPIPQVAATVKGHGGDKTTCMYSHAQVFPSDVTISVVTPRPSFRAHARASLDLRR